MKVAAKNLAEATIEILEKDGEKLAAKRLFDWLKKKSKLKLLPEIFSEIDRQLEARGEVVATVVSARPLLTDETDLLISKIKASGSYQKVEIKNVIDQQIIGGLKITYADRVILGTIRNRLNELKQNLLKS